LSSKLSLLFKEQSCTSFTYKSDIKSIIDLLINILILNSILDSSFKYPLLRSLSVPLLNSSKRLLTLDNNTIINIYTPILIVVSIDLINTKQALGPFLGGSKSMLEVGLKVGLYYRS